MRRGLLVGLGAVLMVVGVIFALQGAGVLGGSAMSGVGLWAVLGPVIAVAGLAIVVLGIRHRSAA